MKLCVKLKSFCIVKEPITVKREAISENIPKTE
jgi:hypothetical protein